MTQIYDFSLASRPRADVFDRFLWALAGILRRWRERRELKQLLAFDGYLLADMGVTREQVAAELAKPLWKA